MLPGLSVPGPPVPTVLVVSACYRMLHAGAVAGIRPLLVGVPPAVRRRVPAGPPVLLGVVRWAGAAVASAWLLQVAGWLTAGPVAYRVAGFVPALGAGAVLGLGVFVTFPVVRPIAR